jgi:hypothetical protein
MMLRILVVMNKRNHQAETNLVADIESDED